MSSGELDLAKLLATLEPKLRPGEFVFVTLPDEAAAAAHRADALGSFVEAEGLTLIVPAAHGGLPEGDPEIGRAAHDHARVPQLARSGRSDVPRLAELASLEISCNVVAAYFHDHIFVSVDKAEQAVEALRALQAESAAEAAGATAKPPPPPVGGKGGLPPWWIMQKVKPEGPERDMGTWKAIGFSAAQQAQFGVDEGGEIDRPKWEAAIAARKAADGAQARLYHRPVQRRRRAAPPPAGGGADKRGSITDRVTRRVTVVHPARASRERGSARRVPPARAYAVGRSLWTAAMR